MSGQDPVAIFRIEARDLLEQVELDLLTLAERQDDRETIDAVFRSLHTLKGSGAMFGFDALAAFTHHCETAFDRVRKGEVAASPALISAVLAARDHMRALAEGEPTEPGVEEALLDDLRRAVDGGLFPVLGRDDIALPVEVVEDAREQRERPGEGHVNVQQLLHRAVQAVDERHGSGDRADGESGISP